MHKKKLTNIFGINLVFLLAFLITSIPIIAQAQICRIPINYNNWNPWANFDPTSPNFDPAVLDQLKCSYWGTSPEGHYQFYIDHSGIFCTDIDISVSKHLTETNAEPCAVTIQSSDSNLTFFTITEEDVDGAGEVFVRVRLNCNSSPVDLDPNAPGNYKEFSINVRPVDTAAANGFGTIFPAANTTIYNFFNAYIQASINNRIANGRDGLYCFMDANDLSDPNSGWDLAVIETGAFADLSNLMIRINATPGPGELGESTYGLRYRAATTGARYYVAPGRNNIVTQQFLDQTNSRNATTDYGVSVPCPTRSFDIRLPIDPLNPPVFVGDGTLANYTIWYNASAAFTPVAITVDPVTGDYILRLSRAAVLAAGITDATWNDLPVPLMLDYDNGLPGGRIYAGIDDGVGAMLMRVQIFDDRTVFVFSSDLDPTSSVSANDFRIFNGAGEISPLDATTFSVVDNTVVAGEPLDDGDRVKMAADNDLMDLNGNPAIVFCPTATPPGYPPPYEVAHTVRSVQRVAATGYWEPGAIDLGGGAFNTIGEVEIKVEYSGEMSSGAGQADDPAIYEVTFPDAPGLTFTPSSATFDPWGIAGPPLGFGQQVVSLRVAHTITDTSPANMPTVTVLTTTDPGSGEVSPLGDTGGDFVGETVWTAEDKIGPFIVQAWYMIDGECGKTSATLLSEGKHNLMIEWSEPLAQSSIDAMAAEGHDWLVFGNIGAQVWPNIDLPFGEDWILAKGDAAHIPDGIDPARVLSIMLGTSDNGAGEIIFPVNPGNEPTISITPQNLDDFVDAAGNPVATALNAITGINNLDVPIDNMTTPWIERASTRDGDANGKIDGIILQWNRHVAHVITTLLHAADTVDNSTVTSPIYGPRTITAITPAPQLDPPPPAAYTINKLLTLTETAVLFEFDTDFDDDLYLYIDGNTYFQDLYGNVRDQMHPGGCPVSDGAPAVPIKACIWNGAVSGTYEVEIHFSEAVNVDPNDDPDQIFTVTGADPAGTTPLSYKWLNNDGTDGILNFMITAAPGAIPAPPTINIVGNIEDNAGNVTPNGFINAITGGNVTVEGPADKPDYFAYPDLPPFDVSGPMISDASMDLEGYVTKGGVPLDQALYSECSPCCAGIVMAFKHKDLFDPDPLSPDYGKLIIDPARCVGATRLRRHDGYYAMHVYGQCCADCDEGEAIIMVVAIYNTCNIIPGSSITAADWPLDATDPKYIDDLFIMTGLVPADAPRHYLEWKDSQSGPQPLFNMELDDCEKIYLRPGWNSLSTTIDKLYYDGDGTPLAPIVNANVVALRNSANAVTADSIPYDDIEKVFATISPPLPVFTTPLGWTACCTFDLNTYPSSGYVLDYPSTHTLNGQNVIAYFTAGSGYLINMANPGVLVVLGTSVLARPADTQPYTKNIRVGWNMVGYWSNLLSMTSTAPNVINFKPGDFSTVWDGSADNSHFTPDTIFINAGATHLRTNVNIDNGTFTDKGVRVWDSSFQTFDFEYVGPGMGTWLKATTNALQFD